MDQKKDDRRTAYSKKVIRDALVELLKTKPLNKITVTEICALADVNRSTFYTYYEDIFDLHRKILRDYFRIQHETTQQITDKLSNEEKPFAMTKKDFYNVLLPFFTAVYENRELFRFIYNENETTGVHMSTGKLLFRKVSQIVYSEDTPKSKKAAFRKAFSFVRGGIIAMVMRWLNNDCAETPDEITHHAASFTWGVFFSELQEFNFNGDR